MVPAQDDSTDEIISSPDAIKHNQSIHGTIGYKTKSNGAARDIGKNVLFK